jgi:hypothetical protein
LGSSSEAAEIEVGPTIAIAAATGFIQIDAAASERVADSAAEAQLEEEEEEEWKKESGGNEWK